MFHVPEKFRVTRRTAEKRQRAFASDASFGNEGLFMIDHYKIDDYWFNVMASSGFGWEHVSVSLDTKKRPVQRCPTWDEMCYIKSLFWDAEDCVVQFHPPKSEHVSFHNFCLHLWKPIGIELPLPDSVLVGIKTEEKV